MKLSKVDPRSAPYVMQALTVVARAAEGGLGQPQSAFLHAVQRSILQTDLDVEALPPVTPEELRRYLDDDGQARQLIRLMVVTCLANGLPSSRQISLVTGYAAALRVEEPSIGVISHLASGRIWRFRLAFMRRSHIRYYFRNSYRISGSVLRVIKAVLIFRGVIKEDANLVSRYRALERLPAGSLGYQFFRHLTDAPLPFPGEHGGFPEGAIFHDFAHVLGGFDTSPEGEMQAAAFQAGFTRGDHDFFTWLFSIVLHTTGINLLPFAIPLRPGRIGEGSIAMYVLNALHRGSEVAKDLGTDWDFWQDIERPVAVVRERLGVRPIAEPMDERGEVKPGIVVRSGRTTACPAPAAIDQGVMLHPKQDSGRKISV